METGYFTPQNAMRRFFYIEGLTADDFYSDSGMIGDIEWALFQELQQSGYERIIYYDKDWKMYCFDDTSYQLMIRGREGDAGKKNFPVSRTVPGKNGLKKGKWGAKNRKTDVEEKPDKDTKFAQPDKNEAGKGTAANDRGEKSGIRIKYAAGGRLHGGMQDNEVVFRQIDACMNDASIRTAVVINDASDFVSELGSDRQHNFRNYAKLPSYNENIMVFIFPDNKMISILSMQQLQLDDDRKNGNIISICGPNTLELRNMLNYFRMKEGLRIRMSDILDIALACRQGMSGSTPQIRVKEMYHRLRSFAKTGKKLTKDNCYLLFGEEKPKSAEEQLNHLIGMEPLKQELLRFKGRKADAAERTQYLTSSRLQPDLPVPERKDMMHIVLTGNPGVGKTTVAKLIGRLYCEMGYLESGKVVETDREGLVDNIVGGTAIKTRKKIMEAMGGVLFVDEAYSLKPNEHDSVDFGQEAIDTLVKAMDEFKGRFIVVAAGYPKEMERFIDSNPGLNRRFRLHLHIDDYTPQEMQKILELYVTERGMRFSDSLAEKMPDFCENWVELADAKKWGNGGEAVNLADNLEVNWNNDPKAQTIMLENRQWRILEERHIPESMRNYLRPVSRMREEVLELLDGMTGLSGVKKQILKIRRRMVVGDKKEPGHYVFIGNPGTGKTTVARYMGMILRSLGMLKRGRLVEYTAGNLVTEMQNAMRHGQSFEDIANPALDGVLFIDEAYQLADTDIGRKIIGDLVPFMENNRDRVCVICAGYEDDMKGFLEENIGLSDRFSETIRFDNYTGAQLCEILLKMLETDGYTADGEYREYSLRALSRYVEVHGKEKDFGNARYVREKYMKHSLDVRAERLIGKYGEKEIPETEKMLLTGMDIPKELLKYTRTKLPEQSDSQGTALDKVMSMIGFAEVKENLANLLRLGMASREEGQEDLIDDLTLHWALKGNAGTGKTTVAKLIGQVYRELGLLERGHCVKVTRADLVAEYVGQTAPKTREWIEKAMGGVLFIDEAYMLKRGSGQGSNDFGQEAIDTILEAMTDRNGEFAVIAAGYPDEMDIFLDSNPGFASRFCGNIFNLTDYTAEEVAEIFALKCQKKNFLVSEELKSALVPMFENMIRARIKGWANGREAENLEKKMRIQWTKNQTYRVDESGNRRRIYELGHLPEEYAGWAAVSGLESAAGDQTNGR